MSDEFKVVDIPVVQHKWARVLAALRENPGKAVVVEAGTCKITNMQSNCNTALRRWLTTGERARTTATKTGVCVWLEKVQQ